MHPTVLLLSEQYRASASLRTRETDSKQSVYRYRLGILLAAIAIAAGIFAAVVHSATAANLGPILESSVSERSIPGPSSGELDRQFPDHEFTLALCRRLHRQSNEPSRSARGVRSEQRKIFRLLRGCSKRVHVRTRNAEIDVQHGELPGRDLEPAPPCVPD